jgi:hypothetical protein
VLYCASAHSVRVVVVVVVVKCWFCHSVILSRDDNCMATLALKKTELTDKVRNLPYSEPV